MYPSPAFTARKHKPWFCCNLLLAAIKSCWWEHTGSQNWASSVYNMDADLPFQNQWASVFFDRGFCFVHLRFPGECHFPCFLFKNRLFQSPTCCTKVLATLFGHMWASHCHKSSLHNTSFCAVEAGCSFSVCALPHLGLWRPTYFARQISFLLTAASVQFWFVWGLSFQKSLLPCWQVGDALLMGRERIKGQKANFHALSCYHWSDATHLLYQLLVKLLHHFTVHQLHHCVQHLVMKVIQGKEIAICGDGLTEVVARGAQLPSLNKKCIHREQFPWLWFVGFSLTKVKLESTAAFYCFVVLRS